MEYKIMSKFSKSIIAAFVVWSIAVMPLAVSAAEPKSVIDVSYINVNGDVKGFIQLVTKARAIGKKLRPAGNVKLSVYMASKAGAFSGTVVVVAEHPSHSAWAEAQQIVQASPEWQALMAEFGAKGYKLVSSGLSVEIARFE
jgi:hypothetical protein